MYTNPPPPPTHTHNCSVLVLFSVLIFIVYSLFSILYTTMKLLQLYIALEGFGFRFGLGGGLQSMLILWVIPLSLFSAFNYQFFFPKIITKFNLWNNLPTNNIIIIILFMDVILVNPLSRSSVTLLYQYYCYNIMLYPCIYIIILLIM